MRQNPITARLQVGGRSMPSWFSASLVRDGTASRRSSGALPPQPQAPPPPAAVLPIKPESDYEEIDHLPRYSNANLKHPTPMKRSCSLCGNGNGVVRCEMCNNQIFCGSCNDMYHRHPKRHNHVRKILDAVDTRPPLPPKSVAAPEAPVPPPRRLKQFRGRSATNSPTPFRKVFFDPMGSLKRQYPGGMEQRPLPPPPKPAPPLPPKSDSSRGSMADRRHSSQTQLPTTPQATRNIPLTVLEFHNQRAHDGGREFGWDHQQDLGFLDRPRAQSISTSHLNRFNSSSNISHIATLQRKPKKPIVCGPVRPPPPPIPPRELPPTQHHQHLHHQPISASAFNLNQMDEQQMHMPWGYPYPYPQQPMFYPGMKRTPSSSSMSNAMMQSNHQPLFDPWSGIRLGQHHNHPMTASERELQLIADRRGSEPPPPLPPYGNQLRSISSINDRPHFDEFGSDERSSSPFARHENHGRDPPFQRESSMSRENPAVLHPQHRDPFPDLTFSNPSPLQSNNFSRGSTNFERGIGNRHEERQVRRQNSHQSDNALKNSNGGRDAPIAMGDNVPGEGYWACEWCTLVNSNEVGICSACCKTRLKVDAAPVESQRRNSSNKSKRGKSPGSKKPAFVRSTLSFSRNDKEKTSARVEKQIVSDVESNNSITSTSSESSSSSKEQIVVRREHFVRKKTPAKSKTPLISSNEEVYGSIPLQSLTITPRETKETKVSTAVGCSPPPGKYLEAALSAQEDSDLSKKSLSSEKSFSKDGIKPVLKRTVSEMSTTPLTTVATTSTSTSTSPPPPPPPASPPPISNLKTSKGTSPPPQSISTQTYEELPTMTRLESKSTSKSSIAAGLDLMDEIVGGRKMKDMSDKELRYTRKAQQQSKLKRSMSTHLTSTSTGDPYWMEANEGRHLYRSSSRHSLASDTRSLPLSGPPSREVSPPRGGRFYQDLLAFRPPSWDRFPNPADFFEDLVNRRRNDSSHNQEFELTRLLKEAVELGFSPEDVQVALRMCGERNPIKWLQDNWGNMVETVQTLATKYGREKGEDKNQVGTVSTTEAKEALRQHRGNVWVAVTECVEQRRKKFLELQSRGNFLREDIVTALTANHGKLDAAYVELSKAQLKPFLMQIWGPPIGLDNEAAPSPPSVSTAGSGSPPLLALLDSRAYEDVSPTISPLSELQKESPAPESRSPPPIVIAMINSTEERESEGLSPANLLQVKRGSLEEDPFLDADEEAMLESSLKDTTEVPSDIEDSEAFVSDLLQNFQILPQSPAAPSSNIASPQPQPPAQNHIEEVAEPAPAAKATSATEAQTITPSNFHMFPESLKLTAEGTASQINFSMEAVLQLLEQQRLNLLKAHSHQEQILVQNAIPSTNPVHNYSGNPQNVTPLVGNAEIQAPSTFSHITTSEFPSPLTHPLGEGGANPAEMLVGQAVKEEEMVEDENGEMGIYATENIHQGQVAVFTERSTAPGMLQPQTSVDSGDLDLDPSIYEEVDSGENFSLADYLRNEGSIDGSETSEELGDDSSEVSVRSRSDEEDEEEEEDEDEEEIEEDDLEEVKVSDDDALTNEVYERIEPLQESVEKPVIPEADVLPLKVEKEIKPEVKRLFESGLSDSLERAEMAVQLMDMKFTEEDSVHAAKECGSIYSALSYLQQECLLCAGKFSATQMISMLRCTHWCCKSCAKDYFQVQVRDKGILDATCPFCKEPSNLLEDSDAANEYFNHLDILLKNLLEDKHHEMFQRKLRDYTLSNTPNFKWCSKCSSGFITEPLQTRLVCPDCSAVTCAVCLEPWDRTHDHRDQKLVKLCDDSTKSIVDYLNENCIECPRCRLKFALARGGCMHLTCSQCKFEFCSGCSAPFRLASKCNDGPFCLKLGLHAHHPRNCLFYLRDKEAPFLAQLLEESAIPYLSEQVIDGEQTERRRNCQVSIQKETAEGLLDDVCGNEAPPGFANVCQAHYIEYLGLLIWQNRLDPVSILSNDDLETILKRAHKKLPSKPYGTKDTDYRAKLLDVITAEIPL